jgi:serine/threonine protein kinase
MSLVIGSRLGPYEVLALLGVGGMGEVYLARDHKLNRDIALKVLPDLFAADPEHLARFQREAHLLASLNHPHIAAIYGFEDTGDVRALVLELVEGQTLADRLATGRLEVNEAFSIARQIADALEAAHNQGIVHRDLKPSNIKLRSDGTVKVLDFGLAKAMDSVDAGQDFKRTGASQSPTLTSPAMTRAGVILGTAAYMSPEQARGAPVDKRTDNWAFGCILYEMLTGSRAFEGDHVTDALAAVVRVDPDWGRLPPNTPPGIRRLVRRCLEKDRRRRLRDVGDALLELDDGPTETPPERSDGVSRVAASRERIAWVSALVLLSGIAVALTFRAFRPMPPTPEMRLEITTPWVGFDNPDAASLALSPNAEMLAFVAAAEGLPRLWVRYLNSTTARPISGTSGATLPFWSPDSRSIGFFADGKLKRVDVDSGSVQILANAPAGRGGTWSRDGVILFTASNSGLIQRISAAGGEAANVTRNESQQLSHIFPQFLPDNRHFLYMSKAPERVGACMLHSSTVDSRSACSMLTQLPFTYHRDGCCSSDRARSSRRASTWHDWN